MQECVMDVQQYENKHVVFFIKKKCHMVQETLSVVQIGQLSSYYDWVIARIVKKTFQIVNSLFPFFKSTKHYVQQVYFSK